MEFAVGIMLVLLGILTLTGWAARSGAGHAHVHAADPADMRSTSTITCMRTATTAPHPHGHRPRCARAREAHTPLARLDRSGLGRIAFYQWLRPFAVGLVHGLAGSGRRRPDVLSIIREPVAALGYLLLFGLGTIVGMMLSR